MSASIEPQVDVSPEMTLLYTLILTSLAIRIGGAIWTVGMARRQQDARLYALTVILTLAAGHHIPTLVEIHGLDTPPPNGIWPEVVAMGISATLVIGIIFLERMFADRLRAETLLSENELLNESLILISGNFLYAESRSVDRAINETLKILGTFLGADRGFLFTISTDDIYTVYEHEWCREGVAPHIEIIPQIPVDDHPISNKIMLETGQLYVADTRDLPHELREMGPLLEQLQIRSFLAVPMLFEGRYFGILGFNANESTLAIRSDHVDTLTVVGEIISSALHRRNTLRNLEEMFVAFDSSIDGMAILGADQTYTYVNPAHAKIYGFSDPEMMVGTSWKALYREDELARFEQEIMPALHRSGQWFGESTGRRSDGSTFPQELTLATLENGGLICVVRDITRRKASDQELRLLNEDLESRVQQRTTQLRDANRELEAFSYSVSHDLRSPLRGIDGVCQALLEDYQDTLDSDGLDLLRQVREASQRIGHIIDDMLTLSQITRGTLQRKKFDLTELIQSITTRLQEKYADTKYIVDIEPNLNVNADPRLLQICLENLLENAFKYSTNVECPQIKFGITRLGGTRTYFVQDNGIGFDPGSIDDIFKPFKRLPEAKVQPGDGIGLATVQRIVHRHGGRIWAWGEPGNGATIYFTLGNGDDRPLEDLSEDVLHYREAAN
jgi:PAS domain S-box-containing protein